MKNLFLLFCFSLTAFLFTNCASKSKLAKAGLSLVPGSELTYEVQSGNRQYPFNVKIKENNGKRISFDWDMGETRSGTIVMTEAALTNSKEMYNYFSGGHKKLENETSVWISQELFKALKTGQAVTIGLGGGDSDVFKLSDSKTWTFGETPQGNPYKLPVFVIANNDGSKEVRIVDDPQNRLIVMMNIGFKIELKGYKI